MRYDALYGRQSVDKKDSISVESQLEYCRYEAHGAPCLEYTDRGFSGKNTRRPGFERMTADIRAGKVGRVIVYKLDRISRSILDFANMMEMFKEFQVEFVSSTEKFDTSTPIGRAMLNICIVFAQLERETIQKRVADAYCARSKRGFYMGGRVPYGFCLKETVIDQVRTSMYEEVPAESGQLKLIYSLYADPGCSLGDIVRYLGEHQIENLRGSAWNSARLSELLRNPIYVKADWEVYHFFLEQGAEIYNPADDFAGGNGCYLYQRTASGTRGQSGLKGKEVVLAPHQGIISPEIWLACRRKCLGNRQSAKTCKPKNSWLSGKVKCGRCGYALVIRRSKTRWERYFVCSRAGRNSVCAGCGCTVYADVLEEYMLEAVREKLSEMRALPETAGNTAGSEVSPKMLQKKLRIAQLEEEIQELVSQVRGADGVLMAYINERVRALDQEKQTLCREIRPLLEPSREEGVWKTADHAGIWERLSFGDKQAVADLLIEVIRIADGTMEIIWNL